MTSTKLIVQTKTLFSPWRDADEFPDDEQGIFDSSRERWKMVADLGKDSVRIIRRTVETTEEEIV